MSEIVLPLTFAVVLAVVFQPAVEILVHHRFKPAIAAGLVVVGLLALMTGVVVATVRGVTVGGYIPYIGAFLGGGAGRDRRPRRRRTR